METIKMCKEEQCNLPVGVVRPIFVQWINHWSLHMTVSISPFINAVSHVSLWWEMSKIWRGNNCIYKYSCYVSFIRHKRQKVLSVEFYGCSDIKPSYLSFVGEYSSRYIRRLKSWSIQNLCCFVCPKRFIYLVCKS